MNEKQWEEYLNKYTGDIGTEAESKEHLDYGIQLLQEWKIDHNSKICLDIGCNTSYLNGKIKAKWYGCDIQPKEENIKITDAHNLSYHGSQFDIVFSSHLLEHTIAPILCLEEMKRVLKDDGDIILGLPLYPEFIYDGHNYVLPEGSWKHLFTRIGLRCVNNKMLGRTMFFHLKEMIK